MTIELDQNQDQDQEQAGPTSQSTSWSEKPLESLQQSLTEFSIDVTTPLTCMENQETYLEQHNQRFERHYQQHQRLFTIISGHIVDEHAVPTDEDQEPSERTPCQANAKITWTRTKTRKWSTAKAKLIMIVIGTPETARRKTTNPRCTLATLPYL